MSRTLWGMKQPRAMTVNGPMREKQFCSKSSSLLHVNKDAVSLASLP